MQSQALLFARTFAVTRRRFEINKVLPSAAEATQDMQSNSTLLAGGFGLCGVPDTLINEVEKNKTITGLTAVSNNAGVDGSGLGLLLASKQIKKMMASYVGENKTFERMYLSGEIELELVPQGTLAERCRAGGAGIPAFYTPAAFGTVVQTGELPLLHNSDGSVKQYAQPRDVKVFSGKSYVMEEAIKGDYAFVKAWKADKLGNCQFRFAAANFNGAMGRNAKMTVVEAEHIVEPGEIDPATVHLPGIYVKRVVQSTADKKIEKRVFAKDASDTSMNALGSGEQANKRERIVRRAAKEFKNGMYANLGIGMPMLAPSFLDPSVEVQLQSENGILGLGPYPQKGQEDPDLINAGKETVSLAKGAAVFGSDESFCMIRSGRVDLTILGAMQVSAHGDLANCRDSLCLHTTQLIKVRDVARQDQGLRWRHGPRVKPGGHQGRCDDGTHGQERHAQDRQAMCLSLDWQGLRVSHHHGAGKHPGFTDSFRILLADSTQCVFDVDFSAGLTLVELAEGVTVEDVKAKTEAPFKVADGIKPML